MWIRVLFILPSWTMILVAMVISTAGAFAGVDAIDLEIKLSDAGHQHDLRPHSSARPRADDNAAPRLLNLGAPRFSCEHA